MRAFHSQMCFSMVSPFMISKGINQQDHYLGVMRNVFTTNKKTQAVYVLVWFVIASLHTLLVHFGLEQTWLTAMADAVVYSTIFALMGFAIWYVVRFNSLNVQNLSNTLIAHLVAALILITTWLIIGNALLGYVFDAQLWVFDLSKQTLWWRSTYGIILYCLIALNYYLLIYYKNYREKHIQESEMKTLLKESELSMLKAQINPHFIFNSLNSISMLTLTKPESAHEMIVKLSSFLRHTIGQSEAKLVTIEQELEAIQLYLDIEKSRFGDKLQVTIDKNNVNLKENTVPNMILQPLLENAIKYGVYESTENTEVKLVLEEKKDMLYVTVRNDVDNEAVLKQGNGIGLQNVSERLSLIYERNDLIRIDKSPSHFKVTLKVPQQ